MTSERSSSQRSTDDEADDQMSPEVTRASVQAGFAWTFGLDAMRLAFQRQALEALRDDILQLVRAALPNPVPEAQERWINTAEAARRLGIDRSTLDAMVSKAPKTLPGAPTRVGQGRARQHFRWDGERLDEWAEAYRDWLSRRGKRR
jgi:predicted DNA-binding transcriptional regulator AlpA